MTTEAEIEDREEGPTREIEMTADARVTSEAEVL
jgi:hypothetical protein